MSTIIRRQNSHNKSFRLQFTAYDPHRCLLHETISLCVSQKRWTIKSPPSLIVTKLTTYLFGLIFDLPGGTGSISPKPWRQVRHGTDRWMSDTWRELVHSPAWPRSTIATGRIGYGISPNLRRTSSPYDSHAREILGKADAMRCRMTTSVRCRP